jgi:RimJ/RimL family protein N-acetyltransferase
MIFKMMVLFGRAKRILKTEGLAALLRRGFPFLARYFFRCETYYLYEQMVKERSRAEPAPKLQGATFRIVSTNQQADELLAEGLDFRSHFINARQWLDKGVIAFCVFVNGEFAHASWVVMDAEAKQKTVQFPCQVDFSNSEAYLALIETNPEYRQRGVWSYAHAKLLKFLREKGVAKLRSVVSTGNVASQRGHVKFGARPYAEARYLKLLCWKFWKENPLTAK